MIKAQNIIHFLKEEAMEEADEEEKKRKSTIFFNKDYTSIHFSALKHITQFSGEIQKSSGCTE